eukprot:512548-Rhodomonas_salina.1
MEIAFRVMEFAGYVSTPVHISDPIWGAALGARSCRAGDVVSLLRSDDAAAGHAHRHRPCQLQTRCQAMP